ncbi:MAG: polysaccharide biosynthesis protein [Candidatus Paceibacterota bacterium]
MLNDEKIFITGGAGYLGRNLIKRYYDDNEITIFSRDESKHYYLKKQFPKIRCIIGDIRNYQLLKEASRGHTIGIFAASLKQIEAVDQNVEESLQVIVHGAINSRRAASENGFKAATFISTDKSRGATTIYGAMKYVAGEAFIANADETPTRLTSVIYGNVLNSTGSIIPLIWDSIKNNYELTLYGEEMTRFMIDIEQAIDCIEYALKKDNFNIIPNLKSLKIKDLFEIFEEEFRLKWKMGTPRISEKFHEQMISPYERERVTYDREHNMFLLHNKNVYYETILSPKGLTSEECLVTKEELHDILKKYNYFSN